MLRSNEPMMLSEKLKALPILERHYEDTETVWSVLELINLLETIESRALTSERIHNVGLCTPALADRPPSIAWSSDSSDATQQNHEYYILRTGSDKYVLLRGDLFEIDAEVPATRSDFDGLLQSPQTIQNARYPTDREKTLKKISKSRLETLIRARLQALGAGKSPSFHIKHHAPEKDGACNWFLITGPHSDWSSEQLNPMETLEQLRIVDGEFRGRFILASSKNE